jgi:hypothetical protein
LKQTETVKCKVLFFYFKGRNFIPMFHHQGISELPLVDFVELLIPIIPVKLFLTYYFEPCTFLILLVFFHMFFVCFVVIE